MRTTLACATCVPRASLDANGKVAGRMLDHDRGRLTASGRSEARCNGATDERCGCDTQRAGRRMRDVAIPRHIEARCDRAALPWRSEQPPWAVRCDWDLEAHHRSRPVEAVPPSRAARRRRRAPLSTRNLSCRERAPRPTRRNGEIDAGYGDAIDRIDGIPVGKAGQCEPGGSTKSSTMPAPVPGTPSTRVTFIRHRLFGVGTSRRRACACSG